MPERPPIPPPPDLKNTPKAELRAESDALIRLYELSKTGGPNRVLTVPEYKRLIALLKELERRKNQPPEQKNATLEKAIEIFGRNNVHGKEDMELLLGFTIDPKDIPPIPYTEEELLKTKEIKERTGVEEMLVLFVKDKDGTLLTGEKLNALIQKKYTEMGLGKFLFNTDSYQDDPFHKTLGLTCEWKIITKQCIPNSKNKRHHFEAGDDQPRPNYTPFTHQDTQEYAIEQYANAIGIPRASLHRPEPFQMLAATAVHLVSTEKIKADRAKANASLPTNFIGRACPPRVAVSSTSALLLLAARL